MTKQTAQSPDPKISEELSDLLKEQKQRQTRLRHLQEFLTSPTFLDLSDLPVEVLDEDDALKERLEDIEYRILVVQSILTTLEGEAKLLTKARESKATDDDAPRATKSANRAD